MQGEQRLGRIYVVHSRSKSFLENISRESLILLVLPVFVIAMQLWCFPLKLVPPDENHTTLHYHNQNYKALFLETGYKSFFENISRESLILLRLSNFVIVMQLWCFPLKLVPPYTSYRY